MREIYYDTFEQEIVTEDELNLFAAPERYYKFIKGTQDGVFTERWYCKGNKHLDISYGYLDRENKNVQNIRDIMCKENKVDILYLVSYTIPEQEYNKMIDYINNGKKL